jgi:hypothetical protein
LCRKTTLTGLQTDSCVVSTFVTFCARSSFTLLLCCLWSFLGSSSHQLTWWPRFWARFRLWLVLGHRPVFHLKKLNWLPPFTLSGHLLGPSLPLLPTCFAKFYLFSIIIVH